MRLGSVSALTGLLLVACGGGGGGGGTTTTPSNGAIAGTVRNGVISLPVSIDSVAAQPFILDTGSVLTRVDPNHFSSLGLTRGLTQVMTLDVGQIHLTDVEVFAGSLCSMMMCQGSEPAGLLGGALLGAYRITIDYRASTVSFGDLAVPAGVGAAVTTTFALEGGGEGTIEGMAVTTPATRVVLDAEIEGMPVRMVLDTGSTSLVLRPDVYNMIVADGRGQSSVDLATVMGTLSVPTTTLQVVSVAGTTQSNVEAARSPLDIGLLEREVGHPVDGLLGGAYLQHYLTTIDYPARALTLRPYQ